mgnify:CR=1 FL=1
MELRPILWSPFSLFFRLKTNLSFNTQQQVMGLAPYGGESLEPGTLLAGSIQTSLIIGEFHFVSARLTLRKTREYEPLLIRTSSHFFAHAQIPNLFSKGSQSTTLPHPHPPPPSTSCAPQLISRRPCKTIWRMWRVIFYDSARQRAARRICALRGGWR